MLKRKKVIKNDNQDTSVKENNVEDRAEIDAERKNLQEYFRSKPRPSEILGHGIIIGETIIEATCQHKGLRKYTHIDTHKTCEIEVDKAPHEYKDGKCIWCGCKYVMKEYSYSNS